MKPFNFLYTDTYQLTMCAAYMLLDQANDRTGFEAFYRRINPKITDKDFYIFDGAQQVNSFIGNIKKELTDPELLETFLCLVKPRFPIDRVGEYELAIRDKWKTLDRDFTINVYPNRNPIHPYVPAVQYAGPKWIGSIIETPVLSAINGATGRRTKFGNTANYELDDIMNGSGKHETITTYRKALGERAKDYREATSKILLEAGLRRAPSTNYALWASEIALNNGWDGTSNTSVVFNTEKGLEAIGGTMAHSFVMSQPDELESYKLWNEVYPNSTILIDTYNVGEALVMLVDNKIKPAVIRLDSEPLDTYAFWTRGFLDAAGWDDVKIFISGDLTPERLRGYEADGVPFDMCMAGTAYVNTNGLDAINAGFVYKLVEFERDGKKYYPQKKSEGKGSISGLKTVTYDRDSKTILLSVDKEDGKFGYNFGTLADLNIKKVKFEKGEDG